MTKKPKNRIVRELEPLRVPRKRSLGEVRRELRERHALRLATAAECGIDTTELTADEIDRLLQEYVVEHMPTVDAQH